MKNLKMHSKCEFTNDCFFVCVCTLKLSKTKYSTLFSVHNKGNELINSECFVCVSFVHFIVNLNESVCINKNKIKSNSFVLMLIIILFCNDKKTEEI